MKNHKHHRKRIHKHLKKKAPRAVKKAKRLFKFKYPKLAVLILAIILAYYIFSNPLISQTINQLETLSYSGIFIAGMLLAFGFTAPFAVGFLIFAQPQNILFAALLGALGATTSDILIFKAIKFSFMNEFEMLKKEKIIGKINSIAHKNIRVKIRHYVLYIFAGILIATPLPDEMGVSMLAGLTTIKQNLLALLSFILHFIAIFIILSI